MTKEKYKTEILREQISYLNKTSMLQQLCIICIFQQASVGGKYLPNMAFKTDIINSDYGKRIENKMEDENLPNKIYLNQKDGSNNSSNLLMQKKLKKFFKKYKSSDLEHY